MSALTWYYGHWLYVRTHFPRPKPFENPTISPSSPCPCKRRPPFAQSQVSKPFIHSTPSGCSRSLLPHEAISFQQVPSFVIVL